MKRIYRFFRYNKEKKLTVYIYFLTALYRFMILTKEPREYEKYIGEKGKESPKEVPVEDVRRAYRVGRHVCRVSNHTPWESKCLVRALTAGKILADEGISTTLYLGVGKENDKMIAHAWLRCGECYVTGGDGTGYAMVAKFLCKKKA